MIELKVKDYARQMNLNIDDVYRDIKQYKTTKKNGITYIIIDDEKPKETDNKSIETGNKPIEEEYKAKIKELEETIKEKDKQIVDMAMKFAELANQNAMLTSQAQQLQLLANPQTKIPWYKRLFQ